jgi:hypothetical protein
VARGGGRTEAKKKHGRRRRRRRGGAPVSFARTGVALHLVPISVKKKKESVMATCGFLSRHPSPSFVSALPPLGGMSARRRDIPPPQRGDKSVAMGVGGPCALHDRSYRARGLEFVRLRAVACVCVSGVVLSPPRAQGDFFLLPVPRGGGSAALPSSPSLPSSYQTRPPARPSAGQEWGRGTRSLGATGASGGGREAPCAVPPPLATHLLTRHPPQLRPRS